MQILSNEELIQEWSNSLRLQNKSDLTINEYVKSVNMLLKMPFFQNKNLIELDRESLYSFRLHRVEKDQVTARTLNKNLAGLISLLDFFLLKEYIAENFFSDIRVKDKKVSLPRPIDVNAIHEILDNKQPVNPKYTNQHLRDLAAAEVAYSGGLRISELHAIKLSDINLSEAKIHVTGKGDQDRFVFLGKKAIEALSIWKLIRSRWIEKSGIEDCGYLFISPAGKHISKNHLGACITALLNTGGFGRLGSTHTLRHSFASHLYNRTKDIRAVQEMLGHKTISSTQVYVLVDHDTLIESYKDAHPRANKE